MTLDLKGLIASGRPLLIPGVYDALSALLAEQAGFGAVYISGASISYTQLGRPDVGLASFEELAAVVGHIRERIGLPIFADAETGYGDAMGVGRTVRVLERLGANGIEIEDQVFPKRCGHLTGKSLVKSQEMVGKIKAATDARRSEATLIIGRTDAIAVEGFEAALGRAETYLEAGADILFVEAPRSIEEMDTIVARFGQRVPLLASMVEGGITPIRTLADLGASGFDIVIAPGALVRAFVNMASRFLGNLKESGSTLAEFPNMVDFTELNNRLGMAEMTAIGERYDPSLRLDVDRISLN
jgi:2-methylisocitrate lyase-like PEP mutase family enzyme